MILLGSYLQTAMAHGAEHPNARPNVLFIAFDDLKPLLGCYGDTKVKTPNIDRLAESGMVFLNNQCQQAVCGPTRASLLTGLRPDTTQIWDLKTRMRDILPDVVTLPQYFKQNGYQTVGMGKIFDGRCCDGWGTQDVISWSKPARNGTAPLYAEPGKSGSRLDPGTNRKGLTRPATECADVPDTAYRDGQLSQMAVEELKLLAAQDEPFFLAVGFLKPHLPFTAPQRYWELYQRSDFALPEYQKPARNGPAIAYHNSEELRNGYTDIPTEGPIPEEKQLELLHGYYATVSFVDAQLGKVLDALDELGLADNTIVLLWGDHGFHLGDHNMYCKHSNFEQATRAPLIVRAPGKLSGASTVSPTEFLDIFPTLCELAGLDIPAPLQGTSLLPLLDGSKKAVKEMARSQYPRSRGGKPVMGYAYRSQRYRYVKWIQMNFRRGARTGPVVARELYDYQEDPDETVNVVDDKAYQKIVKWFEERIDDGEL